MGAQNMTKSDVVAMFANDQINIDQFKALLDAVSNPVTDAGIGQKLEGEPKHRGRTPGVRLTSTLQKWADELNTDPKCRFVAMTWDEHQALINGDKPTKIEPTIATAAPVQPTKNNPKATDQKGVQRTNNGQAFGSKSDPDGPMSSGQSVTLKRKCHVDFRQIASKLPSYSRMYRLVSKAVPGGDASEEVRDAILQSYPEVDCRRSTEPQTAKQLFQTVQTPNVDKVDKVDALEAKVDKLASSLGNLIQALGGAK